MIHLDKNEKLKGLEHLDFLYQAIVKKMVLVLVYKSFKAREASRIILHPYILKEYNNRWFLIGSTGHEGKKPIVTFALDRIISVDFDTSISYRNENFKGDDYYKNVIGVTVTNSRPERIQFKIDHKNAPYVITKPFHPSQREIKKTEDGVIFNIFVQINFELERLLLGFGESLEVIKPLKLRNRMKQKLKKALHLYDYKQIG